MRPLPPRVSRRSPHRHARATGTQTRTPMAAAARRARACRGRISRTRRDPRRRRRPMTVRGGSRRTRVHIDATRCTATATPAARARLGKLGREPRRAAIERVVEIRLSIDRVERRETGCDGQRIRRIGAGLIHRSRRCDQLHEVASSAERRQRQPTARDLADGDQIRRHAVQRGCAATCHAKAAHDLVEDQHGAVTCASLAKPLEESRFRRHAAHVPDDGLDDEGGDACRARPRKCDRRCRDR